MSGFLATAGLISSRVTDVPKTTTADLLALPGTGPLWGMASSDLNATLLTWPAGHSLDEHVNAEVDVLLIVLEGSGLLTIDDRPVPLTRGTAVLIEKGSARSVRAGETGIRYVSVHKRRGPLQLTDARTTS